VQENIMNKKIIPLLFAATLMGSFSTFADVSLKERVAALEAEVAELKEALAPIMEKERANQIVTQQRAHAKERMRKDSEFYSRDELREIETLYQVANKQWRTEEGKESLEELINKYDKANRTGCALLYLGQMSKGEERIDYLEQAIAGFSDCFYGDGVQVGAYARFYLASYYKKSGEAEKASELFSEICEKYPSAIDHKGNLLSKLLKK
jgi:tetratricopeptide (TPR) repeat protein